MSAQINSPTKWIPTAEPVGGHITRSCNGNQQQASGAAHLEVVGIPLDQATIFGYALGYIASIITVFLIFLPTLISVALLLLLAGAVQLVSLLLRVLTVGVYRSLVRLFRSLAGGLPRGRGGDEPIPH